MKLRLFALFFSLASLSMGWAYAEESAASSPAATPAETGLAPGGVAIEGERMQIYLGRKLKSIGDASLLTDKEHIYGDRIEYDMQNQELHVIGDVRIEYEGNTLWGPELRYSLEDNTGEMKNASFRMNSQFTGMPQTGLINATEALNKDYRDPNTLFDTANQQLGSTNIEGESNLNKQLGASRGDAETILFEGQNKKRLKGARYTTCEADSDDWYIKAGEIEIDDYTKTATATNARVEFMGVPFLYTPWMSFSFLNQRKSGFLAPTVGSTSRSGFEVLTRANSATWARISPARTVWNT